MPSDCDKKPDDIDICGIPLSDEVLSDLVPITYPRAENGNITIPFTLESSLGNPDLHQHLSGPGGHNLTDITPFLFDTAMGDNITAAFEAFDPEGRRIVLKVVPFRPEADDLQHVVQFLNCSGTPADFVVPFVTGLAGDTYISGAVMCVSSANLEVLTHAAGQAMGIIPIDNNSSVADTFTCTGAPFPEGTIMAKGNPDDLTEPTCFDKALVNATLFQQDPRSYIPVLTQSPTPLPTEKEDPIYNFDEVSLHESTIDRLIPFTWPLNEDGNVAIRYIKGIIPGSLDEFPEYNMTGARDYSGVYNLTDFMHSSADAWFPQGNYTLTEMDPAGTDPSAVIQVAYCPHLNGDNESTVKKVLGFAQVQTNINGSISGGFICLSNNDSNLEKHEFGHILGFGAKHPNQIPDVVHALEAADKDPKTLLMYSSAQPGTTGPTTFEIECLGYATSGVAPDTPAPTFGDPNPMIPPAAVKGLMAGAGITALVGAACLYRVGRKLFSQSSDTSHADREVARRQDRNTQAQTV